MRDLETASVAELKLELARRHNANFTVRVVLFKRGNGKLDVMALAGDERLRDYQPTDSPYELLDTIHYKVVNGGLEVTDPPDEIK